MGFLCGFAGAFLGAITGCAAVVLGIAARSDGNDLGDAFAFVGLAPFGLVSGAILGVVAALKLRRCVRNTWDIPPARRKTAVIVTASILAVPVFAAVALWSSYRSGQPPSDQELLRDFDSNRDTLNALVRMKQVDKGLQWLGGDLTPPPDHPKAGGVSPDRIANYRRLLIRAGVHWGLNTDGATGTDFTVWSEGSAISSDTDKGYAYLTVPPKQTLSNLDNCGPDGENMVKAYRHIEGRWYLYYDYLPG